MKNKTTAALLALFLGCAGAHHFYLNSQKTGFLYLGWWALGILYFAYEKSVFVVGVLAVLCFIDFIVLISTQDQEFNEQYNKA